VPRGRWRSPPTTRTAPARIAGLAHNGHRSPEADADVTLYRPDRDLARMFALPAKVFKAGVLLAENGQGITLAAT
jgi:hypothetical protein